MQTWRIGNRDLNAEQVRAYRDGKFDPKKMKFIKDTKNELEALRGSEKDAGLPTYPETVSVQQEATSQATEPVEVEEEAPIVSELVENQKLREKFDKLKEIGYTKLKGKNKENYKKLKKELNL